VGHDAEYIASYLNQVDSDFRQLRERTGVRRRGNAGSGPPPGRQFQQWIDMGEPPGSVAKPTQPNRDPE
jgi:hypothetical protein